MEWQQLNVSGEGLCEVTGNFFQTLTDSAFQSAALNESEQAGAETARGSAGEPVLGGPTPGEERGEKRALRSLYLAVLALE